MGAHSSRKAQSMIEAVSDDSRNQVGVTAHLLHHASLAVYRRAELIRPSFPHQALALGVYLAQVDVAALLPKKHELSNLDVQYAKLGTLPKLILAEQLTVALALHEPNVIDTTQLVADLGSLVREAQHLGY